MKRPCVVCQRGEGERTLIDGVAVDICKDCEVDDFRRAEAVRRTQQLAAGGRDG